MNAFVRLFVTICLALAGAPAALAQSTIRSLPVQDTVIESYIAHISYRDLVNSNGQSLTNPWQVLRQDRANFHRYGIRDPYDKWDSFFGSATNRAIMEDMLRAGSISSQAARDIMSGQAVVLVEIYGSGTVGRSIHVTVAR